MSKEIYSESGFANLLILTLVFGLIGLIGISQTPISFTPSHNPNVEGVLLAKGGDDGGGGGSSGGDSSGSSGSSSGGGSSSSSSSGSSDSNNSGSGNSSNNSGSSSSSGSGNSGGENNTSGTTAITNSSPPARISNDSLIECTGPDGKHIQVPFKACADLNRQWNKSSFQFTAIKKTPPPQKQESKVFPPKTEVKKSSVEVEVKVEAKKPEIEKEDKPENFEQEIENELENEEIKDFLFKPQGEELETEVHDATGAARKLNANKGPSSNSGQGSLNSGKKIKLTLGHPEASEGGKEIELEADDNTLKLTSRGVKAETKFPISFDKTTGQLIIQTGNGPKPIRILPDQAAEIARSEGVQKTEKVEIVENTDTQSTSEVEFKISGTRAGSLLGIIPISGNVETEVSADNGQVTKVTEPLWLKILSPLIS